MNKTATHRTPIPGEYVTPRCDLFMADTPGYVKYGETLLFLGKTTGEIVTFYFLTSGGQTFPWRETVGVFDDFPDRYFTRIE